MPVLFQCQYASNYLPIHVRGILLIYGLHELSDDQRHALYPLDLLLRSYQLPFQAPSRDKNRQYQSSSTFEQGYMPLLILDVFLLQLDVSAETSIIAAYRLRERSETVRRTLDVSVTSSM